MAESIQPTGVRVFVGLGSNLDDPLAHIRQALRELKGLPQTRLVCRSSLYRSRPLGPVAQPDYINAVAELETGLEPEALLSELQAIEQTHGRERGERWGPRTLDLDILLYGDRQLDRPHLRVPHPELTNRAFVLYPLAEIAEDLSIPGWGPLAALLVRCPMQGLERLYDAG